MGKIEMHSLFDLIKEGYPMEYIKKIMDEVLIISIQVKGDYPNYKTWFLNKQVPGVFDGSRNIIIAHIDNEIVGFVNLKKDNDEKKRCTFYIPKLFRRNK